MILGGDNCESVVVPAKLAKSQPSIVDVSIVSSHFEKSPHSYRDSLGLPGMLNIRIPPEFAVGCRYGAEG